MGRANFNLNQAMNNLLVAQAAKEQSDKNIAIATAQSVQRDNGNKTYIFSGCEAFNYPSYSGSSQVESMEEGRVLLTSGRYILLGECTQKEEISVGDLIYFEGYWKDGCIHGQKVEK